MSTESLDFASPLFCQLAGGLLAEGHSIRFAARGTSMSPFVRDGDLLTVAPAREEDLRVGDIALYSDSAGRLVAHRVHNRPGPSFLTVRGDNQVETDTIAAGQVAGRAVLVERGGRAYNPASWPNRMAALAATRCRRQWRILRARLVHHETDHR